MYIINAIIPTIIDNTTRMNMAIKIYFFKLLFFSYTYACSIDFVVKKFNLVILNFCF